jgi:hypothetical protein
MRKLLGIAMLPLMPCVWLIDLFFWPSLYGPRQSPWDHVATVWRCWKRDFWEQERAEY